MNVMQRTLRDERNATNVTRRTLCDERYAINIM